MQGAVGADRVCIWLWRPGEEPQRVVTLGDERAFPIEPELPRDLRAAAERGKPWHGTCRHGALYARVIVAPQSGPLGIISVLRARIDPDHVHTVDEIAHEAGFALETANLYSAALAEKEKSAAILERVGDAVFVTDARGRAREWNRVAEWHLGLPPSPATGTCASLLGLRDDDGPLDCSAGCALLGRMRDRADGAEVHRVREDGRRQPLLATAASLTNDEGEVYEVVHSMRDITRLKEAEEAKNLFLATASHELRTPLTVIQGFAQLMQGAPEGDTVGWGTAVDAIARRSQQLDAIVERLLQSSRIEAGRSDVHLAPTDLCEIIMDEVAAHATAFDREISCEHRDIPAVMADPAAVTTVIQHLLENAVKYSPDGGAIRVRAWADAEQVHLAVQDHGIGMAPDHAARCFDKFWQAESTDVRRFGGTGIGLFIVRSLCHAMGGSVHVESALGQGTTFTVTLARATADPVPVAVPAAPAPPPAVARPTRTSERSTIQEFMRQIGVPARRTS